MDARNYRRALARLLPVLSLLGATTLIATPARAEATCPMSYAVANAWPTGFTGVFTLTNKTASTTKGWRVEVHFRAGVKVQNQWDSVTLLAAAPTYVFGNAPSNGVLKPGQSAQFGVIAQRTNASVSPTPSSYICAPQL
jgi:hypothetical protein